jgi:RNA polymerase sigma factor (sigma-70 family)
MAVNVPPLNAVAHQLCSWADAQAFADRTDGELLDRFVQRQEEEAFAALLGRHGPMVLRVARRVLGRVHDAEDVFQATFLLLARRARAIRNRASVGSWLHGVAHRLAVRVRAQARLRQERERQAAERPAGGAASGQAWRELQELLDTELRRLPAKHREALVVCYLEGATQEDAARRLGLPLGTLRSRLARARALFQKRLAGRGLALSGAAVMAALLAHSAAAAWPVSLSRPTLMAALPFAACRPVPGPSARAALLAREGLQTMFAARLKLVLTTVLAAAALSAGAGALALRAGADRPAPEAQAGRPRPASGDGAALPAAGVTRLGPSRFRQEHRASSWFVTAFSPDGKMLATCDGDISLWDTATGNRLREIECRVVGNSPALFSPDGKVLAVTENGANIHLFDSATGKLLRRLPGEGRGCAFSPDGKRFVTSAGKGGAVRLWDTADWRPVALLRGHPDFVHSAAFTPDGTLVTVGWANHVCRWDLATGKLKASLRLPLPEGRQACLAPDGRTLAITPRDNGPVSLWDTETGKKRCALQGEGTAANWGLTFSPDGRTLATDWSEPGSERATISLWDAATGKRLRRIDAPARSVFVLQFAPDGRTLLSSGPEPLVRLWDTKTGEQLFQEQGHAGAVTALAYTPDGRTMVSAAEDGTIQVWDAATGRVRRALGGHRAGVYSLAVAAAGRTVLSGGEGGLRLHDLATGAERRRFTVGAAPEGPYHVVSVGLGGDGRTAASWGVTSTRGHGLFHVWDLKTGAALARREDDATVGYRLFSPGAKQALRFAMPAAATDASGSMAGGGGPAPGVPAGPARVEVQEVATGKRLLVFSHSEHLGIAWALSPDGRVLATTTGPPPDTATGTDALHLWELATGQRRLTVRSTERGPLCRFEQIAFAPDGRTIATARADRTVQLWDVVTGKELLRRAGPSAAARCLAFAADGRALASGHADGSILIWDVAAATRRGVGTAGRPDTRRLGQWWDDLAGEAPKAHAAVWGLSAAPREAVALLRERLRPAAAAGDEVRRLIADLDAADFHRREAASARLAALGEQAEEALQEARKRSASVEQRRRLDLLLAAHGLVRSPELRRQVRAVEVLERVGGAEGRQVLESLAQGAPEARLTKEAKAVLARLAVRND